MKLSIIVPIYNVEKHLRKCVKSLLNQTLDNYEIILVNDGSTDHSSCICDEFAKSDSHIVVIHKKNGGSTSARNTGIFAAKGDYIGFVDSDDWVENTMFQRMYDTCVSNEADMCITSFIREDTTKTLIINTIGEGIYEGKSLKRNLLTHFLACNCIGERGLIPALWCKLIKRNIVLDNLNFVDERIVIGEDLILSCACILDCKKIIVQNSNPPYHYRVGSNQLTMKYLKDYFTKILLLTDCLKKIAKEKQIYEITMQIEMNLLFFTWDAFINEWRVGTVTSPKEKMRTIRSICENENVLRAIKLMKDVKDCNKGKSQKLKLWLMRKRKVYVIFALFCFKYFIKLIKRQR